MTSALVSWVGLTDLAAAAGTLENGQLGPLASALVAREFDQVHLLHDSDPKKVEVFQAWLSTQTSSQISIRRVKLSSPTHFGDIHNAFEQYLHDLLEREPLDLTLHLSPGTPAMTAVSILLGKTKYPAKFIQSSPQQGVVDVDIPFDISAEFLPSFLAGSDQKLKVMSFAEAPRSAAFEDIITQNPDMQRLIIKAEKIAVRDVPVLIMGESGTGKELFAKAIHNASQRKEGPLVVVNCGAIPKELIDSELFGHVKGAFTGATTNKAGYFEAANGGTIFLDEFGELPLDAQVRLLRVLQSGEYNRIGDTETRKTDVRVVAATNRVLMTDIAAGKFREDLFYRVAVGVLSLPPLRDRTGDVGLLAEQLLNDINAEAIGQPGYTHKILSPNAKNIILNRLWKGNVRELHATLLRASIWAEAEKIDEHDIKEALLDQVEDSNDILSRNIEKNFKIDGVIDELKKHYVEKALAKTSGSKTRAAELLGLKSYQVLNGWIKNLGLEQ